MDAKQQAEPWKAEEQRQVQILYDAMNKAMIETGKQFDAPLLNAAAGAVSMLHAGILSSVAPGRHRKMLREMMERAVNRGVRQDESSGRAQVVIIGKPQN